MISINQELSLRPSGEREKVRFASGKTSCAAWHYPGTSGACVIMASGLGVTKEPGTDRFAQRFKQAGFTVLAFDYRRFGESGGHPRKIARMTEQLDDWQAAIAFAGALPKVDPNRLAIWGFSLSGGHVFRVAARNPGLRATIAHSPLADGQAAAPNALRHTTPGAVLRLTGRAMRDVLGGSLGRDPLLVPLAGEPGTVAVLTTPDSLNGAAALNPDNEYPAWQQAVAARSALRIGFTGRVATRRGSDVRFSCSSTTTTGRPLHALRSARHSEPPTESWRVAPAVTARASWMAINTLSASN